MILRLLCLFAAELNFVWFVCFVVGIPVLSLRFRHLSPALSPIETERENYRQSVGVFMAIRGIRVNDFAPFVPFCGRIEFRVVRVFRGWHPCLVFAVSTPLPGPLPDRDGEGELSSVGWRIHGNSWNSCK